MVKKILSYSGLAVLLLLSTLAFTYGRLTAIVKTSQFYYQQKAHSATYMKNDRYQPIVDLAEQYPDASLYFLANSINPAETATTWQLIQTSYLLYPKIPKIITFGPDNVVIRNLGNTNAIVITPFKQGTLFDQARELHPHSEYYIYLFATK
ncbi:hypothetical protein IT418_00715 [bacterium]|nr:hypothetical protein [bacterium]